MLLLQHHKYFCSFHTSLKDSELKSNIKLKIEFLFYRRMAQKIRTLGVKKKRLVQGDNYNFEVRHEIKILLIKPNKKQNKLN
jgi:hypothetical protein